VNHTKIEWADYTFNPVTGCLNNCYYCYAKKITNRFGEKFHKGNSKIHELVIYDDTRLDIKTDFKGDFSLGKLPVGWDSPYPFCFEPTLHYYKLNEPLEVKKPSRIFVCSMGELFGHWIPDYWIEEVINITKKVHWHTFIFLTKNPRRYLEFEFPKNCWLGETIDGTNDDPDRDISHGKLSKSNIEFVSFEPLIGEILPIINFYDWIIIGGLTGGYKYKRPDKTIKKIINRARKNNIPVFLKDNLKWNEKIQEFPDESK